ncbi:MAG: hypothetical protein AAGD96_00685, partial [Chloroflexota bacterium]
MRFVKPSFGLSPKNWYDSSINFKFSVAMSIILGLMLAMGGMTVISSLLLRQQLEERILMAADIQRLTLETDRKFQQAQVLQRDFFARYEVDGLQQAQSNYALPATSLLKEVQTLADGLESRLIQLNFSAETSSLEAY